MKSFTGQNIFLYWTLLVCLVISSWTVTAQEFQDDIEYSNDILVEDVLQHTKETTNNNNNNNKSSGDDAGLDDALIIDSTNDSFSELNKTKNGGGDSEEDVPATRVAYSTAFLNNSYKQEDDFKPRGMEHLYFLTNLFLDLIRRDEEMPPQLSSLVASEIRQPDFDDAQARRVVSELEEHWDILVIHYIGVVSLIALGVLIALVMPIIGLLLACCRCAGRCGAGDQHYNKRDPCKRATLATFLAALLVVILLGLVCAFVTNGYIEKGVQRLPGELHQAVDDTNLFLTNTKSEVDSLLVTNYGELQEVLFNKLDSSGELVKTELARVTKAIAVENLYLIATNLQSIRKDLSTLREASMDLKKQTTGLRNGLNSVAQTLRQQKSQCRRHPQCKQLINEYAGRLEINPDFNKLPDVEEKLVDVTLLIDSNIEYEVRQGKRAFDSIATTIQDKVKKSIPEIKRKVKHGGEQLRSAAKNVSHVIDQLQVTRAHQYLNEGHHYIAEYAHYRYWGFLGVCVLLLLILFCFTMGVAFGCCGRRADEATSCVKSTGATWLLWGVAIVFLFSIVMMLTTTALFAVGTSLHIFICDPLADPAHSEVVNVLTEEYSLDQVYPGSSIAPPVVQMVRRCHNNESLYSVLSLERVNTAIAELRDYRAKFGIDDKVAALKQQIVVDTDVVILTDDAKLQLRELASSSVAQSHDEWSKYIDMVEKEVLRINLLEFGAQLNRTADQLPQDHNVTFILRNEAIFLKGLQGYVSEIKTLVQLLRSTSDHLSESLKFNKTSLHAAITDLISQAEFAQTYLRTNGSKEVIELVDTFSQDFLRDIDEYAAYVETEVEEEVGRCGPVSTVYNATVSAVCKDILYPFNGFWASVGWCFLFFLPSIVLALHLVSLYRKTEPYPGYPSDSSGYEKAPKGPSRRGGGGDPSDGAGASSGGAGGYPAYTADAYGGPRSSAPVADFTTERSGWDYPNGGQGGPPRYTSQPSLSPEYERPPPYYYPGPGNA